MAFCPSCAGEFDVMATSCQHCGHDWGNPPTSEQPSWEFSPLADVALLTAAIASALGCIGTIGLSLWAIANAQVVLAFAICPLLFLNQFGFVVAFTRISRLRPPS